MIFYWRLVRKQALATDSIGVPVLTLKANTLLVEEADRETAFPAPNKIVVSVPDYPWLGLTAFGWNELRWDEDYGIPEEAFLDLEELK